MNTDYDMNFAEKIGATHWDTRHGLYLKEGFFWDTCWIPDDKPIEETRDIPIQFRPVEGQEYLVCLDGDYSVMAYNEKLDRFYDWDGDIRRDRIDEYWELPEKGTGIKLKRGGSDE